LLLPLPPPATLPLSLPLQLTVFLHNVANQGCRCHMDNGCVGCNSNATVAFAAAVHYCPLIRVGRPSGKRSSHKRKDSLQLHLLGSRFESPGWH